MKMCRPFFTHSLMLFVGESLLGCKSPAQRITHCAPSIRVGLISIIGLIFLVFFPALGSTSTITYEYDSQLRVHKVIYDDGTTEEYSYDAAGNRSLYTAYNQHPQLTVSKSGTQQGTVTSSPTGITCGATCSAYFDADATVTLSTTVPPDYHVASWTGCTPNGNTCTLNMGTSNKSVSVSYVIDPLLTVTKSGTQQGTVTSSPSGISCGSTCSDYFPVNSNITLSSTLPSGYCVNWTGCTQNYASCSLNIGTSNKSVSAAYQTNKKLYVARTGTSKKTITSFPSGINCGTDCNESYPQSTVVTLTSATPASGMHVEWTGCTVQGNPLQCVYTMGCADYTVTANFANNHTLTVTKSPTAGGTVTSSPSGINCGATCSAAYGDTLVTLTATPAGGYTFSSWSGCGSTNGNICYVTVNANKTVTATFAQ